MRKVKTERFNPKIKPEKVDFSGVPSIKKTPPKPPKKPSKTPSKQKGTPPNDDTTTPRYHDTTVSRYHDTVELVRKAVKDFGKEAATHRFTLEEKKMLSDIIYAYKGQEIRTSENEITRIAINYINEDYKKNGENSILDKVLKALNG